MIRSILYRWVLLLNIAWVLIWLLPASPTPQWWRPLFVVLHCLCAAGVSACLAEHSQTWAARAIPHKWLTVFALDKAILLLKDTELIWASYCETTKTLKIHTSTGTHTLAPLEQDGADSIIRFLRDATKGGA